MEKFQKIEDYILGHLSGEELIRFENELREDEALRVEVDQMRRLILGVSSYGLKSELQKYSIPESTSSSITAGGRNKKIISLGKWRIAASVLIIVLAGWWVFEYNSNQSVDMDKVFYQDPGLPTTMSETAHYSFYDAMVDYKFGRYREAIEKWDKVTGDIGRDTLVFYKGMAYLGLNELEKSKSLLQSIPMDSPMHIKAKWYMIKILIKQNKFMEAKAALEDMEPHPDYDREEAMKLLESLN